LGRFIIVASLLEILLKVQSAPLKPLIEATIKLSSHLENSVTRALGETY